MRKIKITDTLIERIKYLLDEIEFINEESFENFSKKEVIESAIVEPNYYDPNDLDFKPLEDFYKMQKMKFNAKDNTLDFEQSEHVNIFLSRLGYEPKEILRIERKEKLFRIHAVSSQ